MLKSHFHGSLARGFILFILAGAQTPCKFICCLSLHLFSEEGRVRGRNVDYVFDFRSVIINSFATVS